jgi:hypothetical protein
VGNKQCVLHVEGTTDVTTMLIDDLFSKAQAALANSPFFELHDLIVEQRDGTLFISGKVSSFYHKQLAQEVVRSVCKGIGVTNSIKVELAE